LVKRESSELNSSMKSIGGYVPGQSILKELPEIVVIGDSSYKIEFMNAQAHKAFGKVEGERCHKIFRGSETPCKDCLLFKSKIPREGDSATFRTRGLQDQAIEVIHQRLASDPNRWVLIGKSVDLFPLSDVNYREIANALDVMGDGVTIVDPNGKIVYANKAHEKMHGYSLKELVGADLSIFYPPDLKEETANRILGETKKGGWGGIVLNARKDGSKFWASLKTAPLHDGSGTVVGYLGIVRDVSEMENSRQALREEVIDLEKHLETEMVELSKRFDQLKILQELGKSMVVCASEEEIASSSTAVLVDAMGYSAAGLVTVSESKDGRTFQLLGSKTKTATGKYGRKINEGPIDRAIKERSAVIEKYPENRLSVGLMARSELVIPLLQQDKVLGALVIADKEESRFTSEDVSIADTAADLVAISLANCHGSRQMQDRENALNLLDEMTLQMISRMDLAGILSKTASRINDILNTQSCLIGMVAADEGVDWIATHGAEEFGEELKERRFFNDLLGKVVKSGDVFYTNDYLSRPSASIRDGLNLLVNSILASPIRLRNETIGVIMLINRISSGGFTDENAALVQNFSDHLAVLIHNAENMASLDHSLMTRNSLLRTTFDLQAATGVPEIHKKVADMLLEVVPYDAARFYGITEAGVVAVLSRNLGQGFDLTSMENDFQEIAKKVLTEKKGWSGVLIGKAAEEKTKSRISLIAIPMIGREDEVGAIVIARTAEKAFTDQDREIATLFANHAAITLENALLLTREKEMLDESIQRVRQLESILDLTTSVMSVESQEEAVKKVLSAMTSVLGFNKGLILNMSESNGELECSHSTGFLPREMARLGRVKLPMSDLVSVMDGPGKLVGERTILLNERISPGHPMDGEKLSATRRVMSNLYLEHPGDKFIITIEDNKGELIGVIMLAEATDEALGKSKGMIDLLEIYGNLASIAINNARLFEMEIAARGEVETLNDLMTHDINNFIQGVLGYLDMIGNDESASEMNRKYAQRAIEQIEGTKRLIENVRKLAWIKTGFPEKMSPYDLGKVIGESLTYVLGTYPKKNVNFSSTIDTDQFFVMGDEMIPELFINLISNSVKFTPSQEVPIELGIKTQVEVGKEFWRIEVVDHGRGIPEDKKQFVFERFGKQDYTPYGFGLGLSICRNLARKYGGRIWVEDRVPEDYRKGSKFVILLPKLMPEAPEEKSLAGKDPSRKSVVRKMKEKSSRGTSFSRVLKQPRPGRSEAGKVS